MTDAQREVVLAALKVARSNFAGEVARVIGRDDGSEVHAELDAVIAELSPPPRLKRYRVYGTCVGTVSADYRIDVDANDEDDAEGLAEVAVRRRKVEPVSVSEPEIDVGSFQLDDIEELPA